MLTDTAIRQAKSSDKPRKLADAGGLYLLVTPAGGKLWRVKYRFGGTERVASLGKYPQLSLKDARDALGDLKALLAQGIDPAEKKRVAKAISARSDAPDTLGGIASEWMTSKAAAWSPAYMKKISIQLGTTVLPWLGDRPIRDITAPELLGVLRQAESRGAIETAAKMRAVCGQIFRYAIATGRAERDIAADLVGTVSRPRNKHYAALTEPEAVGGLLRAIDAYQGGLVVSVALRLHPLLFCRPGELRGMKWGEVNLERGEWRYTVSKTNLDHLVPLSRQAVALLKEIEPLSGGGEYVFPGRGGKRPISDMTLSVAFRRMGIDTASEATPHGWRATARTMLAERLGYDPRIIELQLAHSVPDALGRAYNRALFLDERREMMQKYSDYLDGLKAR